MIAPLLTYLPFQDELVYIMNHGVTRGGGSIKPSTLKIEPSNLSE